MSIAGGLHLAVERGAAAGCATIQIFTKNATQWREVLPGPEEVRRLTLAARERGIAPVFSHAGYLLNLASPDGTLREKSVRALTNELERCRLLSLPFTILHPGCHGGAGEEEGLVLAAEGLARVLEETWAGGVGILLENTAGQGTCLGHRFEHLAAILRRAGNPDRLGICFDTAHAFAAGYDLRTPEAYGETMGRLEDLVGPGRVRAIHLNDARKGLGSRVDRHQHIGRGALGPDAFRLILRDPRHLALPKVLETPKEEDGADMDRINLELLRTLAAS
jgi:deoxyribonuclease-4